MNGREEKMNGFETKLVVNMQLDSGTLKCQNKLAYYLWNVENFHFSTPWEREFQKYINEELNQ